MGSFGRVLEQDPRVSGIIEIFDEFRKPNTPDVDRYEAKGKLALANKIAPLVAEEEPIPFVLPGFPCKSPNTRDKVLGQLPDMAEEVALEGFADFVGRVQRTYAPGVVINIVSDGYVFNDILRVTDDDVAAYEEECRRMVAGLPIEWHTVLDFFPRSDKDAAMDALLKHFGISDGELDKRIREDPDVTMLYCGMCHFMQNDLLWPESMSKSRIKKESGPIARAMMLRSESYTGLIQKEFPEAVRISCHPSTNEGKKYSWQFIPNDNTWASPWHRALLVKQDGSYQLVRKADAVAQGHTLAYRHGRPYNFVQAGS